MILQPTDADTGYVLVPVFNRHIIVNISNGVRTRIVRLQNIIKWEMLQHDGESDIHCIQTLLPACVMMDAVGTDLPDSIVNIEPIQMTGDKMVTCSVYDNGYMLNSGLFTTPMMRL